MILFESKRKQMTTPQPTNNSSDLDISFERNIFTNDVSLKTGDDAIRRAIKSLVLLRGNEKPFHPEINTGIVDLLFENANPIVMEEIKRRIMKVIRVYEPRVAQTRVELEYNIDRNTVNVKVLYTIKNARKVFTTSLTLQRTR